MTIDPIDAAGAVLCLTPADLAGTDCALDSLTGQQALGLLRDACRLRGIPLSGDLEVEIFPAPQGAMIFAHPRREGPLWIRFAALSALLRAARALRSTAIDAALWRDGDGYLLALPPGEEESARICCRWGSPLPLRPGPGELGRPLFPHFALQHIYRHFLRLHIKIL